MKHQISSVFTAPFTVQLKSTLLLKLLIWGPHVIALLIVVLFGVVSLPGTVHTTNVSTSLSWFSILNIVTSLALILGIVFSFVYYSRLHIWKTLDQSILEITQGSAKNWTIMCKGKESRQVELLSSSFISSFLIVLNFMGLDKRTYTAVIVPNSLPDQYFRRLLIRVKIS